MTTDRTGRPFSAEALEQLARLEALQDEDIDLGDIPETTDEQWSQAFRPAYIMLDAKLVSWFKDHAGDKPYQTEINRVLRQHVAKSEKKRA